MLERIFIGRRFKNDTERLEKLFDLYTKMIAAEKTRSGKKRMRKYVLFQMTEPLRQSLISQHIFYVEQAQARLLLQFSELKTKESAEQFIKSWMKENQYRFNPSFHDEGDFYAEACERYHALLALGNQTRLSVVSGLYHEWEKQLRQWLVDEIAHWCNSEQLKNRNLESK